MNSQEVFKIYDNKCIVCGAMAAGIHEIVPRSLAPKTWQHIDNRVPLCIHCHDIVHNEGTGAWVERLQLARDRMLTTLCG